MRSKLDLLVPREESKGEAAQLGQKKNCDVKAKVRMFDAGQSVWAQNYLPGGKWLPVVRTGPVSYKVAVLGMVWRRHVDQLLLREELPGGKLIPDAVVSNDLSSFVPLNMEPVHSNSTR